MASTTITSKSTAFSAKSSNLTDTHFNSIHFRKPPFVFRNNIKQKWGSLSLQGGGLRNREAIVEREPIKRFGLVRCTAEGIETGMLGRGQDSNFVMPERLKVVALMACVMCLCNADRVVMSVAVVPLAAKHGWNSSFLGIVQGYFVLLSWMPVYFKTVFYVNLKQAAWFSAVPWGTMAFSGYVAGAAFDYLLTAGYSLTFVRKVMQSIGFIGPGLALLCLNYAKSPTVASVFITVALSLSSFSQAGFLLNMQDIAPKYAGFLHGISNSAGTLAAIISTIWTGYFVQWLGSFQAFLTVTACLYFATAIFWNLFATGERVV